MAMHESDWRAVSHQMCRKRTFSGSFLPWFVEPQQVSKGNPLAPRMYHPVYTSPSCLIPERKNGEQTQYSHFTCSPPTRQQPAPTLYLQFTYTLPTEDLRFPCTLNTPQQTTERSGERARNLLRGREALAGCRGGKP